MKYSEFVKQVFKVKKGETANAEVKKVVMDVAPNIKSLDAPGTIKAAAKCWKSFKK